MKCGYLPCNDDDIWHSFPYFLSRRLHGWQGRQGEYWDDPLQYCTDEPQQAGKVSPGKYCSILALDMLFGCPVVGCCWKLIDWVVPWSESVQLFLGEFGIPWGNASVSLN